MIKRKIEMHHYRQALLRMRQGDSDRDISRSGLLGRRTAASLRSVASARGWLATDLATPDDATIAEGLAPAKRAATTVSSLEAHRERIAAWLGQGVSGVVIHTVLKREHDYTGSYSAVRRMLGTLKRAILPQATVRLSFAEVLDTSSAHWSRQGDVIPCPPVPGDPSH